MASGPVSAVQVGTFFVGQYYMVLQRQPELAYRFYNDASSMVRVDGVCSDNASTMMQIHMRIMSLNFNGIEIKTINSLESWNGGLMVMVSGYVNFKDFNGRRKFVQSFFLAPQATGFFILNDIFQFIDEEVIYQAQSPILSENNFNSKLITPAPIPQPSVSDYVLEENARVYINSVHAEDYSVDKYSVPEQYQYQEEAETVVVETHPQETSSSIQISTNSVQDHLPTAFEELAFEPPVKKTWASILRDSKGQSMSSIANHQSHQKSAPPASEWHHMPPPSAQQLNTEAVYSPPSVVEPAVVSLEMEDDEESRSVYVRNLPSGVTSADLEQEFEKFGAIKKPDGIFIRNREEIGICYAFVEFEDTFAVQNAIQASPIQIDGKKVYIEERRANASSTSRGRGRGRGRGGFQTEAPRGRYGAGRASYQDGNDYYNRARGTGYQPRGF